MFSIAAYFGMYRKASFFSILIIKMSSLGDIVQTFYVLDYLRSRFPGVAIDWVTEEAFAPLVAAHPFVRHVFSMNLKELKKGWWRFAVWKKLFHCIGRLRPSSYDVLFDLQGNSKSGIVTFFSNARVKVGLGYHSVREKPNLLFTHVRFEVSRQMNIREQYVDIVNNFFSSQGFPLKEKEEEKKSIRLKISQEEGQQIQRIFLHPLLQEEKKIMVCPGSQWLNKRIPPKTFCQFLECIKKKIPASFLLVWGSEREKKECEEMHRQFPTCSVVLEKLSITAWQNMMHEVDAVIAVDSSALHLCGMTATPSFSVFGPSSSSIFKPLGPRHVAFQGRCPYGKVFAKTCPQLRTCPTGACMKNLHPEELALAFFTIF
ncbi:MAG: glycosyltransferase family 9 protein [Chlamydiales bacterium]|nr:glycosyltransferase family 9 protein [Chlamydiales bacterium]